MGDIVFLETKTTLPYNDSEDEEIIPGEMDDESCFHLQLYNLVAQELERRIPKNKATSWFDMALDNYAKSLVSVYCDQVLGERLRREFLCSDLFSILLLLLLLLLLPGTDKDRFSSVGIVVVGGRGREGDLVIRYSRCGYAARSTQPVHLA
ncbi:hypothetical protein Peur_064695 [Populus x canadensis]